MVGTGMPRSAETTDIGDPFRGPVEVVATVQRIGDIRVATGGFAEVETYANLV
jgi:hypothetical protein